MALVIKSPPAISGDIRDLGLIPVLGRFSGGRKWQPTPVVLSGESHGQRSLVGYSPYGSKSHTQLKQLSRHTSRKNATRT